MITATRTHEIACGHRVYGHESKCAHLHGHNYTFELTIGSEGLDHIGRVLDFGVMKSVLCAWLEEHWDHKLLLWDQDPAAMDLAQLGMVICPVTFNPTAENMAQHFVEVIAPQQLLQMPGVRLLKCRIWETSKCSATYEVSK